MATMMDIFPTLVCPARWGKLMVCTDASDEGQNAVAVALELAQACDSQVFAVQVLQIVPEFQAVAPDLRATLGKGVQENMAVIKAAADKLGVSLKTVTPQGQLPHAAIVAAAEEIRPDLIIMGRCGKTGLARILMGNVTARVIGHSPMNVLVVPRGGMIGFQRILVASDGSPYSEAAWKLALSMAKQAKSQLDRRGGGPGGRRYHRSQGHHPPDAHRRQPWPGCPLRGLTPRESHRMPASSSRPSKMRWT